MNTDSSQRDDFRHVGSLAKLRERGSVVVRGADRPIVVFASGEDVYAIDNRCPHMGFPLERGTVRDGILTCHWHNARFDLASGCTFDLFADDAPGFDVEIRGGEVYVSANPRHDSKQMATRRLTDGLEQNISLVEGKALIALLKSGTSTNEIARQIALFGVQNRDNWGAGLTALTALARLAPHLSEETTYLALFQGATQVAADCAGRPPRRARQPLDTTELSLPILKRWLLSWTEVRHRDGAERTVLTAIESGADPAQLCDLVCTAATARLYADGGHLLDFCNKAMELLDLIGWQHASEVLPTVMAQLAGARGAEEMSQWRAPHDLVAPLRECEADLAEMLRLGENKVWDNVRALGDTILGSEPLAILKALRDAFQAGARPQQVSKALCYAAAMRVARFGPSNEIGDWITVLHTFSYCNSVHQAIKRSPSPGVARGIFAGAMSVYLDHFLNVPPARLPGETRAGDLPLRDTEPGGEPKALLDQFMNALDSQPGTPIAANTVARYLQLGYPTGPLWDALARATVREDVDFHTVQMLEAGLLQSKEWAGEPEEAQILVAVARYLAAHAPTPRARLQTAKIALRLSRGDSLFKGDEPAQD